MPAMSNATGAPPCAGFFGSAFAAGFSPGLGSIRSWKLKRPSLSLTIRAFRPSTRTRSTMTSPRSSGNRATEACAAARETNSLSAARSESVTPDTFAPRLGQKAISSGPLSASVRPVRSFTMRSTSSLYRFGSKVMAKIAAAATPRMISPPASQSTILSSFKVLCSNHGFAGAP
jgi:hypothetical protein